MLGMHAAPSRNLKVFSDLLLQINGNTFVEKMITEFIWQLKIHIGQIKYYWPFSNSQKIFYLNHYFKHK